VAARSGHEFAGVGGDQAGWADDERVGDTDDGMVLVGVIEPGKYLAHGLDPTALLVVAAHDRPRHLGGVGVQEHRLLRDRVIVPAVE